MEIAKILPKGQITLPVAVRRKLNLNEGDRVIFIADGEGSFRIFNESDFISNMEKGGSQVKKE